MTIPEQPQGVALHRKVLVGYIPRHPGGWAVCLVTYPALPVYCSLRVARAVLRKPTDVQSHSLGALVAWAKADTAGLHRAAADVEALVCVLREILRRSGRSLEELHGEPSRL